MADQFYMQDSRQIVGNDMMWWALGGGYTSDVSKAEVFTLETAQRQHNSRATDIPWPKDYIDANTRPVVDFQYVSRDEALDGTGIRTMPLYAAPQPAEQQPAPEPLSVADYEEVLADHRRLARELDVLLNGEEGAAKQASLCDLVAQLRGVVGRTGKPVLNAPDMAGLVEALEMAAGEMSSMQNEIDNLISYAGGTGGYGTYRKDIDRINAFLAAYRKGGEV